MPSCEQSGVLIELLATEAISNAHQSVFDVRAPCFAVPSDHPPRRSGVSAVQDAIVHPFAARSND